MTIMGTVSAVVSLLCLLTLTTALPSQSEERSAAAAAAQQLTASEQLSQLLEQAVQRVLDRGPAVADSCSGRLERLQQRLDVLELRMTAGQYCEAGSRPSGDVTCRDSQTETGSELEPGQQPQPEPETETEPEPESCPCPEPTPEPEPDPCDKSPRPLPTYQAPHQRPAVLACARSCLQLRDLQTSGQDLPQDGVYWFTGMPVPVFCDFSHDGGGWTLLMTASSRAGWNLLTARSRRELSPSLDDNYSILRYADGIRDLGSGDRFTYRIETQAERGRQRWGGIWVAPRSYSFMAETPDQMNVTCVRKFDKWWYKDDGISRRMPWLTMQTGLGSTSTVLTVSLSSGWGSLLRDEGVTSYQHSSWINKDAPNSGNVLYWMREEFL